MLNIVMNIVVVIVTVYVCLMSDRMYHEKLSLLSAHFVIVCARVMMLPKLSQNLEYHDFADKRSMCKCVPNAADVLSNIPFLLIGLQGMYILQTQASSIACDSSERNAWWLLFFGISLVCLGSGYYHWNPNNSTLVWDRLPMTVGFMSIFVLLLSERVHERFIHTLPLFVGIGAASVFYWHYTDDLRPYALVQGYPLLACLVVNFLFPRPKYTHSNHMAITVGWYVLAKIVEAWDKRIFRWTNGVVSGHTLKHLIAAVGLYYLYEMLVTRQAIRY